MRNRGAPNSEILLVSGFGDASGGGIFAVTEGAAERLDTLSSTGLAIADGRVARLLRSATELYGSELLLYDAQGVKRYVRLDDVVDPHDILWDGRHYIVASPATNSVLWLSPSGDLLRRWAPPGEGDAWHLNSLLLDADQLYAAAFGRFERHREWSEHGDSATGFVLEVATGREVLTGLSSPHHPRRIGDSWIVCNSGKHELLELAGNGAIRRRLKLRSWTRGLAVGERHFYIGESAPRHSDDDDLRASIAVVSREDWRLRTRIVLPCDEIYDIVPASVELVEGVRRGFRTNPVRTAERDQLALFDQIGVAPARLWATGDAIPPDARRVSIAAEVPSDLAPNSWHELECIIENLGSAFLVPALPHPVSISYHWSRAGRSKEGVRSRLPHAIAPRTAVTCRFGLLAPSAPGRYALRLTLVQEGVAWFDEVDSRNAWSRIVRVA